MSTLWKDVVEGAVDTQESSIDTAAIEAMVTEDPSTMIEYVAGCTEGMVALEAAVAMAEGRCAVKYVTATESAAKEEATATMEGVLANAWDALKEMAEKAWEAIKKFIKKAWNKMKGYYNVVKAFFGKYGAVIKGKNVNPEISWTEIDLSQGVNIATRLVDNLPAASDKDDEFYTSHSTGSGSNQSNQEYYDEIHGAFFPDGEDAKKSNWKAHKEQAIKVADQGLDSIYQGMFKLGDKSERDIISDIKRQAKEDTDRVKGSDQKKESYRGRASKRTRVAIYIVRTMASMGHRAATRLYNQSVKACRAVIRTEAETSSATYGAESASLDSFMSEIL